MTQPHWSNRLIRDFSMDRTSTVNIEIDPRTTRASMVTVASRIAGLIDALGPTREDGTDPLADEDAADLLWLLDHLNRVANNLRGQEDRLIALLRDQGVSYARIGSAMEMSAPGVKKRVERGANTDN